METPVAITVGSISLDGSLAMPAGLLAGGIVICHPHPLYAGEMNNPVVTRVSAVCEAAQLATLRFNFRGVGGSGGVYSDGEGEQEDVLSTLDFLQGKIGPNLPLGVAGYSFGAWVGSRVAQRERRVRALAAIAPPLALRDFGFLRGPFQTTLLVAGSEDQYCPVDQLRALAERVPGAEVRVIEEADHFWGRKLYPLGQAVLSWTRLWVGSAAFPGEAIGDGGSG